MPHVLVWSGLVWSGLVWSGLVWSGLVISGPSKMRILMNTLSFYTASPPYSPENWERSE
jgi:hypothetical protein